MSGPAGHNGVGCPTASSENRSPDPVKNRANWSGSSSVKIEPVWPGFRTPAGAVNLIKDNVHETCVSSWSLTCCRVDVKVC